MSWDDVTSGSGASSNGKMDYVELGTTSTVVRVISTEPFSRWTHWLQRANKGKGSTVRCIGDSCPVCAMIKDAKTAKQNAPYTSSRKHTLLVFDRTDNKIKLLEGGNTLFQQLKSIREEGIDILAMDISIKKIGSGTSATYTILPVMNATAKLNTAGMEGADFDLNTLNAPLAPDQIKILMNGGSWEDIKPAQPAANS